MDPDQLFEKEMKLKKQQEDVVKKRQNLMQIERQKEIDRWEDTA